MKILFLLIIALPVSAAQFNTGDRVAVTNTPTHRVRKSPGLNGEILHPPQVNGARGTIIGGPEVRDGYSFWHINYDAAPDGWSISDSDAITWLVRVAVATNTPPVITNAPPPIPTNAPMATAIIPLIVFPAEIPGVTNYRIYGAQFPLNATNYRTAPVKVNIGTNMNWVFESASVGPWQFLATAWKNGVEGPPCAVFKTEVPPTPKNIYGMVWEYSIAVPTNFLPLSIWKLKPIQPQP